MARRNALTGRFNRMSVDDSRAGAQYLHARIDQQTLIDSVETGDLLILVGDQLVPIEVALAHGPAEAAGIFKRLVEFGRIHQKLFRNTPDVDASAAEVALLGNGNPRTEVRGDATGTHATRSGADHE